MSPVAIVDLANSLDERIYGIGAKRSYGEILPLTPRLSITMSVISGSRADMLFPNFDEGQ